MDVPVIVIQRGMAIPIDLNSQDAAEIVVAPSTLQKIAKKITIIMKKRM